MSSVVFARSERAFIEPPFLPGVCQSTLWCEEFALILLLDAIFSELLNMPVLFFEQQCAFLCLALVVILYIQWELFHSHSSKGGFARTGAYIGR